MPTSRFSERIRARATALLFLALASQAIFPDSSQGVFAQSNPVPPKQLPEAPSASTPYWSNRGRWNFGGQIGFALENDIPRNISHIAILVVQPQAGFIVWDFKRSVVRRFEIVNEGIVGNAVHPGGHILGYTLLFRLDGKSFGRVVPFFDAGAGVQHTSLHVKAPELSGPLQFSPQGGLGIQYFFNPQRAFVLEYRYMHMSNAGIEPPNHGFNASMLSIGFRWLRRPRRGEDAHLSHHTGNLFRRLFGRE